MRFPPAHLILKDIFILHSIGLGAHRRLAFPLNSSTRFLRYASNFMIEISLSGIKSAAPAMHSSVLVLMKVFIWILPHE